VPVWLVILLFVLFYWGMIYFDQRSAWGNASVYAPYRSLADVQKYQPATEGGNLERGKAVYENVCALCHNADGNGKPNQAPPFAGSEWVLGSPSRMARIPLAGLSGPLQVKGTQWSLAMPAMGAALSDEDLAAVLSYIRQSWGNKASAITPDQVKAIRAQVGNRSQPWTAEELDKVQ
jgi:mono/diheme cytochrome c family protein